MSKRKSNENKNSNNCMRLVSHTN